MIEQLIEIIDNAADPYIALSNRVKVLETKIEVGNKEIEVGNKVLVISVGKCAYKMAKWAKEKVKPIMGIIVRPEGDLLGKIDDFVEVRSTHPLPSHKSIEASKIIEEEIKKDYSSILFLISGGASALLEDPLVSLEDLVKLNNLLIKSGATIYEINTVRKHISRIKGGRLAESAKSKVITFAVSDVPMDDPSTIGSGPTVEDKTTYLDAYKVLKSRNIWELIPESVKKIIEKGVKGEIKETPKYLNTQCFIILKNRDVLEELRVKLNYFNPMILTSWATGESREIAKLFARIFIENKKNNALLMGGEPEVTVKGKGIGGRNTEFVLSFLVNAYNENKFLILGYATDGIDGNSNAAGAWGDENTLNEILEKGNELDKVFSENNTAKPFKDVNKLIYTGYTGNNVNNIYIALRRIN